MPLLVALFRLLGKVALFVVLLSIAIPLRYGSTNVSHLRLRLIHSALSWRHTFLTDPARPELSADYRAFEEIIGRKPLGEIQPIVDPLAMIKKLRSSFSMSDLIPRASQCQIQDQRFEHDGHQVETYWINNRPTNESTRLIVYLHGGGYIMGDIHSYSGLECHLSQLFNVTLLHVEYRLSPEHPLPAAVQDTVSLYRSLLREKFSPSQLIFMGDSAGGGLALLTIQALITQHLPVPRGLIVLSPWTDLSASGESYTKNRQADVMFRHSKNDNSMVDFILGSDPGRFAASSPLVSPLFGSFQGFPPLYINVGTGEILEDDSRRVVSKAREENVDVTFEAGRHLMHVYPMFYLYSPEARRTLANIAEWLERLSPS